MKLRADRALSRGKRILFFVLLCLAALWAWRIWTRPANLLNHVTAACAERRFEGTSFTVCAFDPARHDLSFHLADRSGAPLRTFAALSTRLGDEARRVVYAMNAGMYDASGNPVGLYVEDGKRVHALNRNPGPGNFHLRPNGVFWSDKAGFHIATTDDFAALGNSSPNLATQSGPMLVISGKLHPDFAPDGSSRHIRNGAGIDSKGRPWFVISDSPVSFGKFARLFRDHLGCPNALYFDGLVSSLWDAGSGRIDQGFPLGPLLVVSERQLRPR